MVAAELDFNGVAEGGGPEEFDEGAAGDTEVDEASAEGGFAAHGDDAPLFAGLEDGEGAFGVLFAYVAEDAFDAAVAVGPGRGFAGGGGVVALLEGVANPFGAGAGAHLGEFGEAYEALEDVGGDDVLHSAGGGVGLCFIDAEEVGQEVLEDVVAAEDAAGFLTAFACQLGGFVGLVFDESAFGEGLEAGADGGGGDAELGGEVLDACAFVGVLGGFQFEDGFQAVFEAFREFGLGRVGHGRAPAGGDEKSLTRQTNV